jgi:glyoxylase-like metal-dependent hydrolase (beta-lactamase superfamily II)
MNRRRLISQLGGFMASAAALRCTPSAWAAEVRPLQVVRLSANAVVVHGPDANVVCVDTDDGLVMIDGGHISWAPSLREAVETAFPGRPFAALFNTHWHPEQTGSNVALGKTRVPIFAHENTKLWLGTEVWVRWSDIRYPPLESVGLPSMTFYDSGSVEIGKRKIDYGYIPKAHTDGDIFIHLPEDNVLVAGGPVSNNGWPIIDWWTGGWTGGMLDGFDSLVDATNAQTRVVPASGPIMAVAELKAQREMYLTIFSRIHELLLKAKDIQETLDAHPTRDYHVDWGDPSQFVKLAFQSTWGHLRDLYDNRLMSLP